MQKRWTTEDEDLIGKYSDEAIALATGRTRAFAILIKRTEPNELKELIKEAVREVLNE